MLGYRQLFRPLWRCVQPRSFRSYTIHLALNVRNRFTKLLNVVTCLRSPSELITTGKAFSIGFYCDCFAGIHCKINGLSTNAQAVKIGILGTGALNLNSPSLLSTTESSRSVFNNPMCSRYIVSLAAFSTVPAILN